MHVARCGPEPRVHVAAGGRRLPAEILAHGVRITSASGGRRGRLEVAEGTGRLTVQDVAARERAGAPQRFAAPPGGGLTRLRPAAPR